MLSYEKCHLVCSPRDKYRPEFPIEFMEFLKTRVVKREKFRVI